MIGLSEKQHLLSLSTVFSTSTFLYLTSYKYHNFVSSKRPELAEDKQFSTKCEMDCTIVAS